MAAFLGAEVTQCLLQRSLTVTDLPKTCRNSSFCGLCLFGCTFPTLSLNWDLPPSAVLDLFAPGLQSEITVLGKNASRFCCKEHSFPNILPVAPSAVSRVFLLSKPTFPTSASTLQTNHCTTRVELGSAGSFQSSTEVVG